MRIVILAAGVGSRLGSPLPKPLTTLSDGRSIMERQLNAITTKFDLGRVLVIVGFKKDSIMEVFPNAAYGYNQDFGETNTSKSLLRGCELTSDEPVLWMNGDVVFEPTLMTLLTEGIESGQSFVCVNTASVGEEEVKYLADESGCITALSKGVVDAHGEAVGINFVAASDKPALVRRLQECDPNDYFERGIEATIEYDGARFHAVDVGDQMCIEVDFPDDLRRVNDVLDQSR